MPSVRHKVKRYGWVPDTSDQRDHLYAAPVVQLKKLPPKVDLRPRCPQVIYDQGQLGSCTGNAIAGAVQFDRLKQKLKPDFIPSRLFIYYNERDMEGTVASDSAAQIRDGIKVWQRCAIAPRPNGITTLAKFATKPFANCFCDASKYKAVLCQRVIRALNQMKGCLAFGRVLLSIRPRLFSLLKLRKHSGG